MRAILIGSAMMLALTACGKKDAADGTAGKTDSPAATAVADLTPGEYETKVEITKLEAAGMPDAALKQMKDAMASQPPQKTCVTEANIAQMKDEMLKKAANAPEGCTLDNRSSGNTIDATVTCTTPAKVTSTVKGTPTDMVITSETDMAGQKINMEMTAKMTRIGDCAA